MIKIWFLLAITFSFFSFERTGEITITGTVTSADDGSAMPGVNVVLKGTKTGTVTGADGKYRITVPDQRATLVFSFVGYRTKEVNADGKTIINIKLEPETTNLSEVVVSGYGMGKRRSKDAAGAVHRSEGYLSYPDAVVQDENTEEYAGISENIFRDAITDPLSTFSIDVDRASYSNVRRFINNGQRPPADAVRIEEMINYFDYDYPQPHGDHPFSIQTEISQAPWNPRHKLVQIGIQGKSIPTANLPPSNLVFLIDVSGSMDQPNKLPLVRESFAMLVEPLRAEDKISIVVYAGAAGTVLEPTPGNEKKKIINALDRLQAGGSTAGGAGLRLAYNLASENLMQQGNNRVIIATDGDFNVGETTNEAMEKLITEKRKEGIFLTVLGFGMGNYKDSKLEILADKGNGNYAYLDNITEARKTLVSEFGGTLFTIAKDVKLQLEFNPAKVKAYRLIGYENRLLNREDFNNDKKDAGEIGSGHTVTALYEVIPAGVRSESFDVDPLKYQSGEIKSRAPATDELLTIKVRYKRPDEDESKLIVQALRDSGKELSQTSDNFRWAASVAAFGMLLRDSDHVRHFSYEDVVALAQSARGRDEEGYRAEFVSMAKSFGLISKR
jgi:Ca-activated chloride channel homolog